MSPVLYIIYISAIAATGFGLWEELRRCLMMYQQNSYRPERYRRWLRESGDTTSGWRLCGIIVFFICLTPFCPAPAGAVLVAIFGIMQGVTEARHKYKKPLVMTARARRILLTACTLGAIIACISAISAGLSGTRILYGVALGLLICYCGSHIIILAAGAILSPLERRISRRYYDEAASILRSMPDLKVIGVTGSYGKTTTKHYLQRILSEKYETLMTPGSYNTTLGVVRTVREMLKPYHQIFIVEMGAKQHGDIREICDLVHPGAGIITAVGPQHLESFGTIDDVQATKFELADALPSDGLALFNNDFEKIADRPVNNVQALRYAVRNTDGADYIATDIKYSASGTDFDVVEAATGRRLHLHTRLVGECNVSNLLGAAAMAHHMGVSDSQIAYAVQQIEQVEHRMSIRRVPGGLTIIDDAFNSNPVGSAMALDVLAGMTQGRRFLITPGMIELGERQYELNEAFGHHAATACDIAIVVGRYNRDAIVDGLRRGGKDESTIRMVDTFTEAQQVLTVMAASGDTVLYENDLPDTFK